MSFSAVSSCSGAFLMATFARISVDVRDFLGQPCLTMLLYIKLSSGVFLLEMEIAVTGQSTDKMLLVVQPLGCCSRRH